MEEVKSNDIILHVHAIGFMEASTTRGLYCVSELPVLKFVTIAINARLIEQWD
jgi:hypothetical protein